MGESCTDDRSNRGIPLAVTGRHQLIAVLTDGHLKKMRPDERAAGGCQLKIYRGSVAQVSESSMFTLMLDDCARDLLRGCDLRMY